ncbi:MAG: hypothetical protein R3C11_26020 [Planctomycetaceae bacterium]
MRSVHQLFLLAFGCFSCILILSATGYTAEESTEAAPTATADDAGYLLRFKFEPNQKVSYKVTYEMTHTTRKGKTTETVSNLSTTMKHYLVKEVSEQGNGTLVSFIDSIKMKVQQR